MSADSTRPCKDWLKFSNFPSKRPTARGLTVGADEDFPAVQTLGAWMQVGDERFSGDEIHLLYESSDYPLPRCTPD
jgi:hypothetical protein